MLFNDNCVFLFHDLFAQFLAISHVIASLTHLSYIHVWQFIWKCLHNMQCDKYHSKFPNYVPFICNIDILLVQHILPHYVPIFSPIQKCNMFY